jgi:hypothetical protein
MSGEYLVSSLDGRFIVKFDWQHDRFQHQLAVDGTIVGQSLEGDSAEIWPASPPIQQISLEQIDGREMVLGVGAAGRSHWSLSAGPCIDDKSAILFDLACRCKESPTFLGSSYQCAIPVRISIIDGQSIQQKGIQRILAAAADGPTRQWSYRLSEGP